MIEVLITLLLCGLLLGLVASLMKGLVAQQRSQSSQSAYSNACQGAYCIERDVFSALVLEQPLPDTQSSQIDLVRLDPNLHYPGFAQELVLPLPPTWQPHPLAQRWRINYRVEQTQLLRTLQPPSGPLIVEVAATSVVGLRAERRGSHLTLVISYQARILRQLNTEIYLRLPQVISP